MLTKADFMRAIKADIHKYPALAPLYHAGDPRILQHIEAIATMLAMYSTQMDMAMAEPFEKSRDATILADAAMRGIVRRAKAARVQIQAENHGEAPYVIESGRTIVDAAGLNWQIETSCTIEGKSTGVFEAVQMRFVEHTHTVNHSEPFYSVQIPPSDGDDFLCALSVRDALGEFFHAQQYNNIAAGERVFHVESDDRQGVFVRFGFDGVVGTQPKDGEQIYIQIAYSAGEVTPEFGSPFAFEYLRHPNESQIELKMHKLLLSGENPPSMALLRYFARYPSVYDSNAVFLGEFDFLVRRNFPSLRFLSVWNEAAEERARGANIENINTLFVACVSKDGDELVLDEQDRLNPVAPRLLENLSRTQREIRDCILAADNSYKVKFYTPVRAKIDIEIQATVATSYIVSDVQDKIREAILEQFGEHSQAARHGQNRPLYKQIYQLLREKIEALQSGTSDLTVHIRDADTQIVRREMWRFVAEDSLMVRVKTANIAMPSWGG